MTEDTPWMEEAFIMAEEALGVGEVPVGCVFVKNNIIIARGRNRVNETKNATKHAEIVALDQLKKSFQEKCSSCIKMKSPTDCERRNCTDKCSCEEKFRLAVSGSTLYVTCEPCIMCAAALRICGVANTVFGCCNDRFGGNGSVLSVHNCHSTLLKAYQVRSGAQADRAMSLLVQFYKNENTNAPEHKRKFKTS